MPDAITADHASQRIYFTNYNSIESANYNGLDRVHLVKKNQAYFFDIAIYQVCNAYECLQVKARHAHYENTPIQIYTRDVQNELLISIWRL